MARAAKKKAPPAIEDGYYITMTVEPAALFLYGPAEDRAVAKVFRKLLKIEGYNESEDVAEVRLLGSENSDELIVEAINPLEAVLDVYNETEDAD